jgi:superkiller protein 3
MAEWKKALELDPEDGKANYNLGLDLMGDGRLDEAIPHFQKAVEVIPDFADAQNNLGFVLLQKGKVDEAIPHLQKAVEANPDFAKAQNNLGIALAQTGKVDDAILHFEEALQIDPRQASTYYNLGGALYMQGKVPAALARYREGLRVDPNSLPLLGQTAWVLATCPEASVRNGPEAIELAERALKVSAGPDPGLLDVLAAAYAEAGRFPQAVQTAQRALHLATQQNAQPLVEGLKTRIALYESNSPFRDTQ